MSPPSTVIDTSRAPLKSFVATGDDHRARQAAGEYPPNPEKVVRALSEDGLRTAVSVPDEARAPALLVEKLASERVHSQWMLMYD